MLKNISNLGTVLSKSEQKSINAGRKGPILDLLSCSTSSDCPTNGIYICNQGFCQNCFDEASNSWFC